MHDFQWWEHEPVYRVPLQQLGPERVFLMVNTPDESQSEGGGMPRPLLPTHVLQPDAQGLITLDGDEYARVKTLLEGVQVLEQKRSGPGRSSRCWRRRSRNSSRRRWH